MHTGQGWCDVGGDRPVLHHSTADQYKVQVVLDWIAQNVHKLKHQEVTHIMQIPTNQNYSSYSEPKKPFFDEKPFFETKPFFGKKPLLLRKPSFSTKPFFGPHLHRCGKYKVFYTRFIN